MSLQYFLVFTSSAGQYFIVFTLWAGQYFPVFTFWGLCNGNFKSSLGNMLCLEVNIATMIFQYSMVRWLRMVHILPPVWATQACMAQSGESIWVFNDKLPVKSIKWQLLCRLSTICAQTLPSTAWLYLRPKQFIYILDHCSTLLIFQSHFPQGSVITNQQWIGGRILEHKRFITFVRQMKMSWRMVMNLKMMLSKLKIITGKKSQKNMSWF